MWGSGSREINDGFFIFYNMQVYRVYNKKEHVLRMEWTALENQILQNRCKLLEMCFQDSLKKPCRAC
jgi:hypothetical protein